METTTAAGAQMESSILLSSSHNGIARAVRDPDGKWEVSSFTPNHEATCLAADPSRRSVAFAGTRDGVLRSDDYGATWAHSGMAGHVVKSLAVSPHDPDTIYAGTKPALLFISRDGGKSWQELDGFRRIPNRWWWFSPAEPPDRRPYVMAIALSPTDPGVILAGVEFGAVVRSTNGGESWTRHRPGALRDCHSLKFHETDGAWAYEAGGTGGGASFSRDGGRTFTKAGRGLAKRYGIVCAADPEDPETWYVCVAPGPARAFGPRAQVYLYRASRGRRWQPIGWSPHPLSTAPTALTSIPGKAGHLVAGLYNGDVWHTADYGDSWNKLPFSLGGVWFSLLVLMSGGGV